MTTTTCGPPTALEAAGSKRGRLASTSSSIASSAVTEGAKSRIGPIASTLAGCWACGSHLAHSQCGRCASCAHTPTSRSSGAWKVATWASVARTRSCTAASGPRRYTWEKSRSAMATGRSGTIEYVATNLRNAMAHKGSSSSTGRVEGGTSGVATSCAPSPMRTTLKSASARRRSHSRPPVAEDQSASGSGWR